MSTTVSDTSKASTSSENVSTDSFRIEEKDELPRNHVGSIIGKGGEMIRDLQARSGCFIVVDNQDAKSRLPPMITYRGKCIEDINFAKSLVSMLCNNQKDKVELALGQASMKQMQVHKSDAGRIIGRRGKMINELQVESQARIQIDHSGKKVDGNNSRLVIITGTEEAVVNAEKMVEKLLNDPIAYSKSSKSSGRGKRMSSSTATTTSSTANSIPKIIDTEPQPQPQYSVASEVLAKRIVELESDLYCARSALMVVQQPYQQQYPQPYCSQPCYHQQPYYYDPHYGWVATASAVDGEVYPYNPAA